MDDQDELTVMLEYDGADPDFGELISRHLRARLGVRLGVEVVAGGETAGLTELEVRQKPRRLIDER
jgi:phenylacetate-CoA ligase